MLSLATELEYKIIGFLPANPALHLVCKEWKSEVHFIRKNAVDVISNWYNTKKCGFGSEYGNYESLENWVRFMLVHENVYSDMHRFIDIPEEMMKINPRIGDHLASLPPVHKRTKRITRDWILGLDDVVFDDLVDLM